MIYCPLAGFYSPPYFFGGKHKTVMNRLIDEHKIARDEVKALHEAAKRYERGDMDAVAHISANLKRLIELYPPHIELEDKHFFGAAIGYFTPEEKASMLDDAYDHDADMAHKKYVDMVLKYEKQ